MVGTQLKWDDYATAWARLHGGFDARAAAPVVRAWLRFAYHVGYVLGRLRVSPTAVTGFLGRGAAGIFLEVWVLAEAGVQSRHRIRSPTRNASPVSRSASEIRLLHWTQ